MNGIRGAGERPHRPGTAVQPCALSAARALGRLPLQPRSEKGKKV